MILVLFLLEQLGELARNWSFEIHTFACPGMIEIQTVSMEAQSADWVSAATVLSITHYRMAQVLHVYANLILSSSLQFHLYQAQFIGGLEGMVVRDSKFASVVGG